MPVLHCDSCHHEWEGREGSKCDWCGGGSIILAAQSDLEKMLANREFIERIKRKRRGMMDF